ncbi:hypothetical protein DQ237_03975 [Blastococcus sp. TF02-8]|nr:hypothetical protein DQ237_03975 [Blastococcus sp. TF02-8]
MVVWIGTVVWIAVAVGELVPGLLLVGFTLVVCAPAVGALLGSPSSGSVREARRRLRDAEASTGPGRRLRVLVARARLAAVRRRRRPPRI